MVKHSLRLCRGTAAGLLLLPLFCLSIPAARAQTVYGPGGLFVHPSAFVPAREGVGLNASYFTQRVKGQAATEWAPVSLTVNATPRTQVGALYVSRRAGGRHRDSGGAFIKHQFTEDSATRPAVALVGSFIDGDVEQSSVSGVLSHTFTQNGRPVVTGHLGVQWVRRTDIPRPDDDIAGFVGLAVPLAPEWSLVGEIGTKLSFNRKAASAVGVVWSGRSGTTVGVGWVNTGRSDENRFFVGVGYPLGGRR